MLTERLQPDAADRTRSFRARRRWLVLGLIGLAAAALSLVALGYREPDVMYAFEVHEALARRERGEPLDRLRIDGALVPNSMVRSDQTPEVSFQMRSLRERDRVLSVRATCEVNIPDAVAQRAVELSVQGRWSEGAAHFEADRVQVRYRYDASGDGVVPVIAAP